jgi:hypothetical protein
MYSTVDRSSIPPERLLMASLLIGLLHGAQRVADFANNSTTTSCFAGAST